ncbi:MULTISPECIES: hypothetical protein [Streptomyces]|uniref:hypothetical protein n=1 Tax=Streptomyces TaxID=1883 RepID=UPI002119D865|nr:hypothetical protein [Streptomyces hilarionis]MCQ9132253.1 hypothetical protein [Streptomyces hilarionis]
MSFGALTLLVLGVIVVVAVSVGSLGVHAFTHHHVPGRPLRRIVRNPRLWGLGLLLQVASLLTYSWTLLVLGLVLTVCGHVLRPTG